MSLPASFAKFVTAPPKFYPLMVGTEGKANTGKTEFILSAPPPGLVLALDRGHLAMLENQTPPPTRQKDFVFCPVTLPVALLSVTKYQEYWAAYRTKYGDILAVPEARTMGIDGDSDSWELQIQAEYGRTTQIMPRTRGGVNAARRLLVAKARDSGKIIIATNKLKAHYETVLDANGAPVKDDLGEDKREWDGQTYKRQGFGDYEYCWDIQLRHLYKEPYWNEKLKRQVPGKFGLKFLMVKANRSLEGTELWGEDCNFQGVVQTVYPHIALSAWGY